MINIYQKTIKHPRLKELTEFKVGSWVNVESPDEKELEFLSQKLGLEPGLLRDALDPNEVPRVEVDEGITYIFARVPHKEPNDMVGTIPVMIAIGKNFIVTVSAKKTSLSDELKSARVDFYTTQKTKFVLQAFSKINSSYSRFMADINKSVRGYGVRPEKIANKDIVRFVAFEAILNDFLSSLVPMNSVLQNILSGKFLKLYEEDEDLAEDLFLAAGQLIESCRANLKAIVNIREAYSTIMTHDLNRVMKLLTALTIILTSSNLIASFYGMNVALPFASGPWAFAGIFGLMAAVIAILLAVFIKNEWL